MKKFIDLSSRAASAIFHPLLIPTWTFLILSNTGFYFSILPWSAKKYIFLVVLLSTGVMPALGAGILSLNPINSWKTGKSTDRILPLLTSSIFYYLGYLLLERMPLFPVFNLFILAAILVQIALIIGLLRYNVSIHSAAIGALIGGFIALALRLHESPLLVVSLLFLVAGLVTTSRLLLQKHTFIEVMASFMLGFVILHLVVGFV